MIKAFVLIRNLGPNRQHLCKLNLVFVILHPEPLLIYFPTNGMFKEGEHRCNVRKRNGWLK